MALEVTVAGRTVRSDHLTLGQVLDLEAATGKTWREINPFASAHDAASISLAMFGPSVAEDVRGMPANVSEWMRLVDDDLPLSFRDCIPAMGGRTFDDYLVAFADPEGFAWPPDVTRRQRVRDLDLLLTAFAGRNRR